MCMSKDVDKLKQKDDFEKEPSSESLKKAMSFVVKRTLPIPKTIAPEQLENLEFPDDLTKISTEQLGQVMTTWTAVLAYTQFEVAKADIEQTARRNKLDFDKKTTYLKMLRIEGITENERAATLVADKHMAQMQANFEYARARYTLLKALLGSYQKYYTALSRELSRRGLGEIVPSGYDEDEDVDITPSLTREMESNDNG